MVSILAKPFRKLSRLNKISEREREAQMHEWFCSDLGQELVQEQKRCLKTVVRNKFGQHMVQLDMGLYEPLVESAPVGCFSIVSLYENRSPSPVVCARPEQLPFEPESVEAILLHHVLDCRDDPYQILREVNQALVPEGVVVIVGFNPWSLWLGKKLRSWVSGKLPWCAQFYGPSRIQDWLSVLDMEIEERYSLFHRPAINNQSWLKRLNWLENLVSVLFPKAGASYVVVGRKKVAGAIPMKGKWSRSLSSSKVLDGSAGSNLTSHKSKVE